jgi:2-octaprenylphenol hydroxylase
MSQSFNMNQSFGMVIIGGGMVGTALAAALENTELSIALIETQLPFAPVTDALECQDVDMRVSALNRASEAFLSSINIWQSIPESRKCAYDKMRVWDGEGTGHIQFDALSMGEPHLGHIVENRYTATALTRKLQQQKNVRIFSPATVKKIEAFNASDDLSNEKENEQYFIHLDSGQILYTPLIVAADGARSSVRHWAEFETREWDYDHHGLVCTVETELSHETCAWQRFTEGSVLAFLPVHSQSDKNLCSIVYSCSEQRAKTLLGLNEAHFNLQLASAFEHKLGKILNSGVRVAIPLRQRHAKSYVKNGIVLIGDAAHTIHPLAGQGVNLGLMDAYVLADEIMQGLKRGLPAHDGQLLARYERRRMPGNLAMMATMESFKRLFAVKAPGLRWLRNWGMNKMNNQGLVKSHIVQEAMGLKQRIRSD